MTAILRGTIAIVRVQLPRSVLGSRTGLELQPTPIRGWLGRTIISQTMKLTGLHYNIKCQKQLFWGSLPCFDLLICSYACIVMPWNSLNHVHKQNMILSVFQPFHSAISTFVTLPQGGLCRVGHSRSSSFPCVGSANRWACSRHVWRCQSCSGTAFPDTQQPTSGWLAGGLSAPAECVEHRGQTAKLWPTHLTGYTEIIRWKDMSKNTQIQGDSKRCVPIFCSIKNPFFNECLFCCRTW